MTNMRTLSTFLALALLALLPAAAAAQAIPPKVYIESPRGGYVADPIVTISGRVDNAGGAKFATLIYNGISQRIAVTAAGRFETKMVLSHGDALIVVEASNAFGTGRDRISLYAGVPRVALKIVLVWDSNGTDMDLWLTGPDGEKVFYGNKTGKAGGQLDIDVTTGYGPETFTMQMPPAGNYQIQVQNFSPGQAPVTSMRIDMILFEGTDREERRSWNITSFRQSEVVNVGSFTIGADGRLDSIR